MRPVRDDQTNTIDSPPAGVIFCRVQIPPEVLPRAKAIHLDNWAKNSFVITLPGVLVAVILLLQCPNPLQHPIELLCFALVVVSYAAQASIADWWLHKGERFEAIDLARKLMMGARLAVSVSWMLLLNIVIRSGGPDVAIIVIGVEVALISATMMVGPLTFGAVALLPLVIGALMTVGPGSPISSPEIIGIVLAYGAYTFYAFMFLNHKMIFETLTTIRLEQTNETIRILLRDFEESASDWLWEVDAAFNLKAVSLRFAEVADRDRAAMIGPLIKLLRGSGPGEPGGTGDPLAALLDHFAHLTPFRDLVLPIRIGDARRWWSLTGKPIFEGNNQRFVGYRGVGADVTASHQAREQNAYLARHDALTGLANRVAFATAVERALDSEGGALLSLDLDAFKAVNDRFGHAMGDRVLVSVANRLRGAIRDGDVAARLGGDEFAILLRTNEEAEVLVVARRVVDVLGRPFKFDGITVEIGTSVGIAMVPAASSVALEDTRRLEADSQTETLIKQADLALYQAKAAGRGTWRFFDDAMHSHLDRRRHLQREVGEAISADGYAVWFQPVVGLVHGEMTAVEAVLHWPAVSTDEHGTAELIGVAEQIGMAGILVDRMLNAALDCGRALPSAVRISIDLPQSLLLDGSKITDLLDQLLSSGIKPERFEFEVTEAALADGSRKCLDRLRQLQNAGCRTAIDHFGLGMASLTRLHEMPFSRLKIHRDFVARTELDPQAVPMLRAMIDMAHALGLVVTADGVTNDAQLLLLTELGCDEAQGPFFAQPMPLAEIFTFPALKIARLVPPNAVVRSQQQG